MFIAVCFVLNLLSESILVSLEKESHDDFCKQTQCWELVTYTGEDSLPQLNATCP